MKTIKNFAGLIAFIFIAAPGFAAPPPMGACCNIVAGCCPPLGNCQITTSSFCEFGYQGDGTVCPDCPATTTTTTTSTTTLAPTTTTSTTTSTTTTTTLGPGTTSTTLVPVSICGDANQDLEITSTDALIALKTAVSTASCPLERCDYNGSGEVTATDALAILKVAVGQPIVPMCPIVI
ncbi:MAG TPA: dockerin type I domain-containing protein [Candidatus Limnocylindrales bacterium]|nr:dockerin type I domain-containing protein [Candidatus Limnocylindrales bacterium]